MRYINPPGALAVLLLIRGCRAVKKITVLLKAEKIKAQNDFISALSLLTWHLPMEVLGSIKNIEHKYFLPQR